MTGSKLQQYLETATGVAVLLTAVVILSILVSGYFVPKAKPRPVGGLQKGASLTAPETFDYGGAERTLLVAVDSKCVYCAESAPFHKRLRELQAGGPRSVRVLTLFRHTDEGIERYLRENQLDRGQAVGVDLEALGVNATPAVILLDGGGIVKDFWIGRLSADAEAQVIRAMSGAGT